MTIMKKVHLLSILIAVLAAASCHSGADKPMAKHVILIGLDGWGAYSYGQAEMPVTKQLAENGSYTTKKRTVLPSSSAVNWASIFMGAGPEIHGYTTWGSKTPELPSRVLNENGMFPTIFKLYRDAAPEAEIGCVADWNGIKYLIDTLAVNYYGQGPDYNEHPETLTEMAVSYIKANKPSLFAVIYDNPDHVGHVTGHDTPEYYSKLNELDGYIGRIVEAVKEAGMIDDTIFIITADHGGIGKGHGGKSMQEMETVFIASGKGIRKGYRFDDISMMQYDCAATMAKMLGLTPPQVWTGRSMPIFGR